MADKIITPEATLSYPWLAEPQKAQEEGKKAKYSAVFVFSPEAQQTPAFKALEASIVATAEEAYPGKGKQMLTTGALKNPIRRDAAAKGYPEGSVFISARTEQQPGLVYAHKGPDDKPAVVAQDDIREVMYPGAVVRASLRPFAYNTSGNKGVSFALNNIQKIREGERLDSRVNAQDEFEALSDSPADIDALLS